MTTDHTTPLREAVSEAKGRAGSRPCEWFALCDHPATTTREAGPLGTVAICARCDAKIAALEGNDELSDEGDPLQGRDPDELHDRGR